MNELNNKKKGTAAEVAKQAGVSVMTVSRVLSGSGYVAEKTKERVRKAAIELGYQQNSTARVLRTGIIETFGYTLMSSNALQGVFHSNALAGFEQVLNQKNWNTMLAVTPPDREIEDWIQSLFTTGRCGGLAVSVDTVKLETINKLANFSHPVVLINYNPDPEDGNSLGVSTVGFSNRNGIRKAVAHLAELGHKEIAYIGGSPEFHDSIRREIGFHTGMQSAGLSINDSWIRHGDYEHGFDTGKEHAYLLLKDKKSCPTAIICAQDELAVGAMEAALELQFNVPDDISIVGFDNNSWTQWTHPPLTTISHDSLSMGKKAADIIIEQIENPDLPPQYVILETQLIERGSSAPPK